MANIAIRVLIIYLIIIGVMRLMGKRQIGELEPFELVITIIIADLATIPMADQTIPIWYGVIPLLVICVIHFAASLLSNKSSFMRDLINGKPVVVIDEGAIDFAELKKLNLSSEELMEALRNLDYFDMSEINYAIVERNGKITVIPKAESMPATREDLKVRVEENDIMYCIIENGRALKKNFDEMGIQDIVGMRDILPHILCRTTKDAIKIRDVAFCSMSGGGDVFIQTKCGSAQSFKIEIPQKCLTNKQILDDKNTQKMAKKFPENGVKI